MVEATRFTKPVPMGRLAHGLKPVLRATRGMGVSPMMQCIHARDARATNKSSR